MHFWHIPRELQVILYRCLFILFQSYSTHDCQWSLPRGPSPNEWIIKMVHIYTMKYYLHVKNN